jgi:dTDP-glucose 4,6-dehydratase
MPVITTNCSNNYGPCQFPEKLIPLTILNALEGKALPIYGTGENVRDWLFVEDHARALWVAAQKGTPGEVYNIGGNSEKQNIEIVTLICNILDEKFGVQDNGKPRTDLITYVEDRPGHDARYAIDASKIKAELGWEPQQTFENGLRETIEWYLDNQEWWEPLRANVYTGQRLGLKKAS